MNNSVTLSDEKISFYITQSNPVEIREFVSKLTSYQVQTAMIALQNESKIDKNEKLLAMIEGLETKPCLESIGSFLTPEQLLFILKKLSNHQSEKLSPLLVGVPFKVFYTCLQTIRDNELEILKNEVLLEPLQHHLNLLIHEGMNEIENYNKEYYLLLQEIRELDLTLLSYASYEDVQKKIMDLTEKYQTQLNLIDKALGIVWHTNRIDLIDKFTRLKEVSLHAYLHNIGIENQDSQNSLIAILKEHLYSVYDSSLTDDDLSIEGLTKLSVWYLKDYWELHLLPTVTDIAHLDADIKDKKKKKEYQEELFKVVQDNLNRIGLNTVADLKKAQIFSKQMLKEYISCYS